MSFVQYKRIEKEPFYLSFLENFPGMAGIPYILTFQSRRMGIVYEQEQVLHVQCIEGISEEACHGITDRLVYEYLVKRKKEAMEICASHSELISVLPSHLFRKVEGHWIRRTDPFLKIVPFQAMNPHGYLIHQGLLKEIVFSSYSLARKGCGMLAVYNLLKLMHREERGDLLLSLFEEKVRFHGRFGISMKAICSVLTRYEVTLEMDSGFCGHLEPVLENSGCGILWYLHTSGAHYVAYRTLGKRMLVYNADYGKQEQICTFATFLKTHALTGFSSVLYVKK